MFGITTYRHKRIVRAGHNTLAPYDEHPPDLIVGEDDILQARNRNRRIRPSADSRSQPQVHAGLESAAACRRTTSTYCQQ
jgi:hypothetical protein